MSELDELVDEILVEGLDDWVALVSIVRAGLARRPGDVDGGRTLAVTLIRELVEGGWMTPGEIGDPFEPWELTPRDSVTRIVNELDAVDWNAVDQLIAWFDTTEKGNQRAKNAA